MRNNHLSFSRKRDRSGFSADRTLAPSLYSRRWTHNNDTNDSVDDNNNDDSSADDNDDDGDSVDDNNNDDDGFETSLTCRVWLRIFFDLISSSFRRINYFYFARNYFFPSLQHLKIKSKVASLKNDLILILKQKCKLIRHKKQLFQRFYFILFSPFGSPSQTCSFRSIIKKLTIRTLGPFCQRSCLEKCHLAGFEPTTLTFRMVWSAVQLD